MDPEKYDFHPRALAALNEQASMLAQKLMVKIGAVSANVTGFRPDVNVAHHLSSSDLRSPMQVFHMDNDGNRVARFVDTGSGIVGFDENTYPEFCKLAVSIHKTDALRNKVSLKFVEDALFQWSLGELKAKTNMGACAYVAAEAEREVTQQEVWVPVYGLHIQSSFKLGPVTFKTISKGILEEWQRGIKERFPDSPQVAFKINRDNKDLLGFAAATYEIEAEPERAKEVASDLADRAISILRLFSVANFDPTKFSYCVPLGSHQRYGHHYLTVKNGRIIGETLGIKKSGDFPWIIDDLLLEQMNPTLSVLSGLFGNPAKSELELLVFNALLLYSKAALVPDLAEKLLYMFAALESVLLRNETEPITESIAERLAYLSADDAATRISARKWVKEAYRVRSKFVHHGRRDDADLRDFFLYAWTALCRIAELSSKFKTKSDLLDDIEHYKFRS
jgi:hypothetical protein